MFALVCVIVTFELVSVFRLTVVGSTALCISLRETGAPQELECDRCSSLDSLVSLLLYCCYNFASYEYKSNWCAQLLEEYMTEAGLRALEGGEDVRVNFPEMAILLQRTVDIYSHKVDCLHQSILDYCDKLLTARQVKPFSFAVRRRSFAASMLRYATRVRVVLREEEEEEEEAQGQAAAETAARRARRRASVELDFAHIALSAAAPREPAAARPPPTLPRMYVELEPRRITAADVELQDYAGEHIGLLSDYQVTCRLHVCICPLMNFSDRRNFKYLSEL